MSAETLRRAAALMRERAEAVRIGADEPDMWFGAEEIVDELMWGDQPQHGDVKADAAHIASWHPAVALAVADWLDRIAEHHAEVAEVYLDECEDCGPDADCEGHDRECCWMCNGLGEDGYAVRVFYPCAEMKSALAVVNAYLGSAS